MALTQVSSSMIGSGVATPAGTVIFYAANTAPTGYLKANGAAVSRTTYADLFAAIGTTFGTGDGSTTFNLPDMRGYFARGWNDNGSIDPARAFGSTQLDEFKSHVHGNAYNSYGGVSGPGFYNPAYYPILGNTSATGGTETRPRNVALLACIKY